MSASAARKIEEKSQYLISLTLLRNIMTENVLITEKYLDIIAVI